MIAELQFAGEVEAGQADKGREGPSRLGEQHVQKQEVGGCMSRSGTACGLFLFFGLEKKALEPKRERGGKTVSRAWSIRVLNPMLKKSMIFFFSVIADLNNQDLQKPSRAFFV